uniref:Arginine N-methyltransferase 2 n=1 Tax=Nakaseomyces delphensis TaxID=51657 RepID=A7WPH3_NAKDE|nr:arginine methyltransferase [Nakaseomyces delphensis]
MSEMHRLLTFPERPISESYLEGLGSFLNAGVPATYTLEQVAAYERSERGDDLPEEGEDASNTTPLHILARSLPKDLSKEEKAVVLKMMDMLFEYGAGWNFIDYDNKTIGDLILQNNGGDRECPLYQRVVEAGVCAELLLRKLNGGEVEFIDTAELQNQVEDQVEQKRLNTQEPAVNEVNDDATAADPETYLKTKLKYTDDALITEHNKDGVMMDWETNIMKLAADTLTSSQPAGECVVLNIGFGMGIIDTFLNEKKPKKHYICEAHPDVLAKMKEDGWYEKEGVVVLEGKWQDTLNKLLDDGTVFFDGIYYDTFSEHYEDMLDLYDLIVGLIKPEGIFSFFNGLGADRQLCYDVYKKIVEVDVATYGMKCEYDIVSLVGQLPDWNDVKRSYFNCDYYYHPKIFFA